MTGPLPFPTMYLDEVVSPSAVHPTEFYSLTDPALDADNHVQAGKRWRKTDNLTTPTWFEVYVRNAANSAWILERAWVNDTYAVGEVPVADADGRLAPGTVTPGAHAASHEEGGDDELDVTTLAGFPGGGTTFLRDDGTFAAAGGGGAHASDHENGGGDEIDVAGLSGLLADAQKVEVSAEGTPVGTRPEINFIEGSNITITVTDDGGGNKVDVEIASGGGGSLPNGGNPNEVLAKDTASDGDATWRHDWGVEPVAPGGGSDLEFNSSTIGGTALGSPAVIDADTTVKGALYISAAASASFGMHGRYWTLAGLSLSLPLTIDAEITDWENYGNFSRHALLIAEATPGQTVGLYVEHTNGAAARLNSISIISSTTPTSGAAYVDTQFADLDTDGVQGPVELRIVATSSSNVAYYYRPRGSVLWRTIRTGHNPGFTIGAIGVTSNPENAGFGVRSVWSHIRFS
jgi:hypothetical protein